MVNEKAQIVVAKDIVCMLASKQSVGKIMGVATILGVDRHNIKKPMERCLQLDASNDVFWITQRQAKSLIPCHTHLMNLLYNGGQQRLQYPMLKEML